MTLEASVIETSMLETSVNEISLLETSLAIVDFRLYEDTIMSYIHIQRFSLCFDVQKLLSVLAEPKKSKSKKYSFLVIVDFNNFKMQLT